MEAADMKWRKSAYSSNGGANCVEAASAAGRVLVRDTTDRDGGTLAFTADAWAAFTARLRKLRAIKSPGPGFTAGGRAFAIESAPETAPSWAHEGRVPDCLHGNFARPLLIVRRGRECFRSLY
jgi:hypothetical protein